MTTDYSNISDISIYQFLCQKDMAVQRMWGKEGDPQSWDGPDLIESPVTGWRPNQTMTNRIRNPHHSFCIAFMMEQPSHFTRDIYRLSFTLEIHVNHAISGRVWKQFKELNQEINLFISWFSGVPS